MKASDEQPEERTFLVTGGAGFIGSHIVDALMRRKAKVRVLDSLSSGTMQGIENWLNDPSFKFVQGDLLNRTDIEMAAEDCSIVFHLAANPEVRLGSAAPEIHFRQNVEATFNLLEALRRSGGIETLVFASSSTVYGDATKIPTPEDALLRPISVYGASKLASEAMVSAYAHSYGFRAVIYRLANVIGPRNQHCVIYDFITKLRSNPRELEILGDGTPKKSYLYIDDCIKAMLIGLERSGGRVEVFNLGSDDWTVVKTIAKIVVEEMGLGEVAFKFTGGIDGGRGWVGDVKYMLLDASRLKSLGWKAELNSAQAVRAAVRGILKS